MVAQQKLELWLQEGSETGNGIFAARVGNVWRVTGNTWVKRYDIRKAGGTWNKEHKAWEFEGDLPKSVREMVSYLLDTEAPAEETPIPCPAPQAEEGSEEATAEPVASETGATTSAQAGAPAPERIVAPSYWNLLWYYTTPGRTRPAVALVGPAGNGKTTVAEEVLRMRGIEYIVIDANVAMEPFDLIGGMSYETSGGEGRQVWVDGAVTRAFREGKGVIINEFDSLDPRTALSLQSAMQGKGAKDANRYITLSGNPEEDRVYPAGDCPVIVTMNTFGTGANRMYTGRNALDAASRDRLTIINTGYEHEDVILKLHGYGAKLAGDLLKWAGDVRQKIDFHELPVVLGMRTLLGIADIVTYGDVPLEFAVGMEFFDNLEEDVRALLKQ